MPDKPPPSDLPEEQKNKLEKARALFRAEDYAKAESYFSSVAGREKNPPTVVQEAMYYEAECLRLQGHVPKAADTYAALLKQFPNSVYREQCVQHMFDIANRWLDDTREQMREDKERQADENARAAGSLEVFIDVVERDREDEDLDRRGPILDGDSANLLPAHAPWRMASVMRRASR